ncbi:MAG TPA: AIR synthase related protein [Thermoanaerobaculia bacterium]|nr:AIR synthase related protein [Thermoanaerobaculia bacterium]
MRSSRPARPALTGEDRLLAWLSARLDAPLIGDDAALLPRLGPLAVTVDSQIAGVHFIPGLDPALFARRLLAVSLSDLAAMGATPAFAFLALAAAPGFDHRRFFRALLAACERFGVRLAGGDLQGVPAGLARSSCATIEGTGAAGGSWATLTLIGKKARRGRWLRRGGAAPGQQLWLGGTVGESAAGRLLVAAGARLAGRRVVLSGGWGAPAALARAARQAVRRHLAPQPQLALGHWLAARKAGGCGGCIDVSDGVARDLHRLCRASRVGARVAAGRLPFPDGFPGLCERLGADGLELGLGGGEDYVLLFTLPAGTTPPARFGCHAIGSITREPSIVLESNGAAQPLAAAGWDHLAGAIISASNEKAPAL